MDVVRASGVSRRFGAGDTAVMALDDVSVAIRRGHLTAVMGPSGSCKSTLMHILAGLDKPTSGSVELDGTDEICSRIAAGTTAVAALAGAVVRGRGVGADFASSFASLLTSALSSGSPG